MKRLFLPLLAAALTACHPTAPQTDAAAVKVNTLEVHEGTRCSAHEYAGTLEEASASTLSFGVGGRVTAVYVKEGQRVKEGQLLASVDKSTAANAYKAAKATLDQAQDGYNRAKQVHDQGSLPEVRWVDVQTQLNKAQSMCDIAKKNLDDCNLYAPTAGTIDSRNIECGSSVTAFQPVMRLLDLSHLYAKMSVPEVDVNKVEVGDAVLVEVTAQSGESRPLRGRVEERNVSADAVSHSYMVRIRILDQQRDLLPGMVCRVRLADANASTSSGIEVPNRAVQLGYGGERYVWVANDGVAHRRTVHIGDLTSSGVLVTDGLREGDRVVVDGLLKISEGTKVEW